MVLDDRRQLPAVFFVWKNIDDSSEDGKDAAECERRWPVLGGWNCAKFPLFYFINKTSVLIVIAFAAIADPAL